MILLSLDFETTGLDPANDRVIEAGAVLWSTAQHRVLAAIDCLVKSDAPVTEEITRITGLTQAAVDRFGFEEHDALATLLGMANQADGLLGQNIIRFDKLVLDNWMARKNHFAPTLKEKVIIDTLWDIPGIEGKKLQYMLADHMVLNPFPHSAFTDALSALLLIEEHTPQDGNIEPILARARSPFVILQSHQGRGNNNDAKKLKFWWNSDLKLWWKAVKEIDVENLRNSAPFEISVRKDLSLDQVWGN